jgi:hypothetical protein
LRDTQKLQKQIPAFGEKDGVAGTAARMTAEAKRAENDGFDNSAAPPARPVPPDTRVHHCGL